MALHFPGATAFRSALFAALSAAVALPPLPAKAAGSDAVIDVAQVNQRISLGLDKTKVIDLPRDAHDIIVANPTVADAVTRTARRIYIFGKSVGQTNVFVFDASGREIAVLDLRIERDISGLEATIRKYLPNSEVHAEMLNDNVVLTGTVENAQDAARAVQLADIYVTGGEATTSQYIKSATSGGGASGGGVAIGGVSQLGETRQKSQIVNMLQIQGEDQVTLKVTVAEVQRSIIKQLGLNGTAGVADADGISFAGGFDNPFALGNAIASSGLSAVGSIGSVDIDAMLRALEQAGVMRTLAEPSLTAISGESASFKVGGEFSIPDGRDITPEKRTNIRDDNGRIVDTEIEAAQVTLKSRNVEYGIGLDFTPVVLSPGRISLKIRTSVSEPSFESPFNNAGSGSTPSSSVVGIRKRLADTTVELPSGGSLVIAGLVRDEVRQVISGYPGLAKIPVLGTLFRSRDFQRYETELVVIVTPYLVRPVARQTLARPDDNLAFSSDGASYFLGRINRVYGATQTALPPGRYHGTVGYIYK